MSSVSAQGVVERASAELSRRITGLGLRGRKRSPGVVERVANALCGPAAATAPRVPRRRRPSPRPLVCTKWRDLLYSSPRWWAGLVASVDCREVRATTGCCTQRFYNSLVRRGIRGVLLISAADDDINEFIRQFPLSAHHVHAISLKGCTITDRGLEAILDHLQVLFELELTGCNEITEAGLWACLTPRIVSLTLTDCINIADEAVGAVAQLLPSLYEFSLQAYHVTDAALGYFSPKQSASLSVLRLHSCWELTNHGVVNIVHSLPNLTVLSLSGCSKVTDEGVELLAENLPRLRSLDLSWCPRVTDNALEYIACDLNHLEELTLDRLPTVNVGGTIESNTATTIARVGAYELCRSVARIVRLSTRAPASMPDHRVDHQANRIVNSTYGICERSWNTKAPSREYFELAFLFAMMMTLQNTGPHMLTPISIELKIETQLLAYTN
ncbi:unnamed protein product [Chilo suppressalis]|uniref:F-box/LRR-repeat protein 15-like leucin rich repeat domain-containing protein n=1 Tax=Chilo suppressalis TaxID=168631 RepID=A0ABN8ASK7_CHISP|nr:unnamed protein product [Chilo suppressalis]